MADEEDKKNVDEEDKRNAGEEDKKNEEDSQDESSGQPRQESKGFGVVTWIVMAVVTMGCAGSGFFLGRLFADPSPVEETPSSQPESDDEKIVKTAGQEGGPEKTWYYELDPVVANLNEPGGLRYVRATLILEVNSSVKGDFLDGKKPVLINCLTIYLTSLTIKDATGKDNLKRIQSQILDLFNENLFPDAKPRIKNILIKEFPIQ